MKILSFDVGIKNLSFCLLNEGVIEDWGILNICTDPICEHVSKTGKRCDKSVAFSSEGSFGTLCVCTAHKKLKCYSSHKFTKQKKCNNPMLSQGVCIVNTLSKKSNFLDVDKVVIENQPALKNPTMKSIQMMIYSYFLIEGVCKTTSLIQTIEMINARHKLKAYNGPAIQCDIKDKYKRTKFLGIEYCKHMIQSSEQQDTWIHLFESSRKKDDLADAYLQGMYVLSL